MNTIINMIVIMIMFMFMMMMMMVMIMMGARKGGLPIEHFSFTPRAHGSNRFESTKSHARLCACACGAGQQIYAPPLTTTLRGRLTEASFALILTHVQS